MPTPKTIYVDFLNGSDGNNGTSFASRVKTLSRADNLSDPGDSIRVMGNTPTVAGTSTWTDNSPLVTISAALSQLLYANGAWNAGSSGVTCTSHASISTLPKHREGTSCCKVATSGFTTGKLAHFPTGAALNLSSYQQLSFWIHCDSSINSGVLSVNLCSDTAGNTIVDTLPINVALNASKWTNVTINKGSSLGSSIQSVRLTANNNFNNKTLYIDNVIACKSPTSSDCLTLGTLISPDGQTWYGIQSVNGTTVFVDGNDDTNAAGAVGYQGGSVSGPLYLLQPTQVSIGPDAATYAQTFADNGTPGNPITISGGWNSTDMSTQTGWTTIDKMDWSSSGIRFTGNNGYLTLDRFNFIRANEAVVPDYETDYYTNVKGYMFSNCNFTGMKRLPVFLYGATYDSCNLLNMPNVGGLGFTGIWITETQNYLNDGIAWQVSNCKIWGCHGIVVERAISSPGIKIAGCDSSGNTVGSGFSINSSCRAGFYNNTARNNSSNGFSFGIDIDMRCVNLCARGNGQAEVSAGPAVVIFGLDTKTPSGSSVPQIVGNCTVFDWVQYIGASPAAILVSSTSNVSAQRENGNTANNSIYAPLGNTTTTGVVGQSGSGLAWKLSPNSLAVSKAPLRLKVGQVICPASVLTTIKYYAKKSAAGVSSQFRIFGGRYPNVGSAGSDIVTAVTSTSWTQYTMVVNPSEDCVIDVFLEAWGSSTENVIVSGPVSITQNSITSADPLYRALGARPFVRSTMIDTSSGGYVAQALPVVSDIFGDDYEYDSRARLTKATYSDQKVTTFSLDDMGNRTNLNIA